MQDLTKVEEDIMQIIWAAERCTVSDILGWIGEPRPPHSTISSVVRILEKKGFVGYKAYGKTHEYFPLIEKDDYARRSLRSLLEDYFDGSAARLVSHLAADENLSQTELDEMRQLLEKL